jgi:hypothetical protein
VHVAGILVCGLGPFFALGYSLFKCGLVGYFVAYFAVLYLPTFWVQINYSHEWLLVDWRKGLLAVAILASIHGLVLLIPNSHDPFEPDLTPQETFMVILLPFFLLIESVWSYNRAKKAGNE